MLKLTDDQLNAKTKLKQFYASGDNIITLNGAAGSGKTTVVKQILEEAERYQDTLQLIDPSYIKKLFLIAATTNKAVSVLSGAINNMNYEVRTIHSVMGLKASNKFMVSHESLHKLKQTLRDTILIIDEVSMLSDSLFDTLDRVSKAVNGKVIFIGDSNQLAPVKQNSISKAFTTDTIKLTQVVRQTGSLIKTVNAFREYVEDGIFPNVEVDGVNCVHLNQEDFETMLKEDMSSNDWCNTDSRVLAYKNIDVKRYNDLIKTYVTGTPNIVPGETVVNSHYVSTTSNTSIPTEANVFVTKKTPHHYKPDNYAEIKGAFYDVIYGQRQVTLWMPDSIEDKKATTRLKNEFPPNLFRSLAELRPEYASTIHKAQGSTFKRVYIDLNSIKQVSKYDLAMFKRLLYVAASRASEQIIFTGDLI